MTLVSRASRRAFVVESHSFHGAFFFPSRTQSRLDARKKSRMPTTVSISGKGISKIVCEPVCVLIATHYSESRVEPSALAEPSTTTRARPPRGTRRRSAVVSRRRRPRRRVRPLSSRRSSSLADSRSARAPLSSHLFAFLLFSLLARWAPRRPSPSWAASTACTVRAARPPRWASCTCSRPAWCSRLRCSAWTRRASASSARISTRWTRRRR